LLSQSVTLIEGSSASAHGAARTRAAVTKKHAPLFLPRVFILTLESFLDEVTHVANRRKSGLRPAFSADRKAVLA